MKLVKYATCKQRKILLAFLATVGMLAYMATFTEGDRMIGPGERVRMYRVYRGFTQIVLSQMTGLSVPTISKIEHGRKQLWLDEAVRLATALKIRLDDLGGLVAIAPPLTLEIIAEQAQTVHAKLQDALQDSIRLSEAVRLLAVAASSPPAPAPEVPSSGLEYLGSEQYDPASSYEEEDGESVYAYATAV